MAEAAGFHYQQFGHGTSNLPPVILLHGSGGSERSLIDFGNGIAPDRNLFAVRGQVPWEGGYAHFKRSVDRKIDRSDLEARCSEFSTFLEFLIAEGHKKPLLVGYSNGAIMAAASVVRAPALSSGAILFRALSPFPQENFPQLQGYPVLLLGGATDARRKATDTPHLAEQFRKSGAFVEAHVLAAGHNLDEDGRDSGLARKWLLQQR